MNTDILSNNDKERFLSHIESMDKDTCWNWKLSKDRLGYGYFSIKTKTYKAHRISFLIFKGNIRDNYSILHSCDNPSCVNPNHLREGTVRENALDRAERNPSSIIRGSQLGNSKLTEDKVAQIIKEYNSGNFTLKEIGLRYGISKSNVGNIVIGKTWKHVEGIKKYKNRVINFGIAQEIRNTCNQKIISKKEILKKYNISKNTINLILRNKIWKSF